VQHIYIKDLSGFRAERRRGSSRSRRALLDKADTVSYKIGYEGACVCLFAPPAAPRVSVGSGAARVPGFLSVSCPG
jgi:hypothetical protein